MDDRFDSAVITEYTPEELAFIRNPIGRALIKKLASGESKYVFIEKKPDTKRVTCKVCNKEIYRKNMASHKKSQKHIDRTTIVDNFVGVLLGGNKKYNVK